MLPHSYTTDPQSKSQSLASTILAASSPPQISAACAAVDSFLHHHNPDQSRHFFSIAFPTLICKLFGFDDSSPQNPNSPNGWIDAVFASNDRDFASRVFNLLSPDSVLMQSISAVDRQSLVKYVFPVERLPEWVRFVLQSNRDCRILPDLCPLFKGRVKEDSVKGTSFQIQLNVFEYYMFWFSYYPVCKGNSENSREIAVRKSRRFRLENWTSSIPGFVSAKRGSEQKTECNLYMRLLYAYLRAFLIYWDLRACISLFSLFNLKAWDIFGRPYLMPSVLGVVLFYCMFLFYIRHVAHAYDHFFNKEFMDESEICSCTSFLWSKNVAQLNKINLAHKVNAINLVRDFIYANLHRGLYLKVQNGYIEIIKNKRKGSLSHSLLSLRWEPACLRSVHTASEENAIIGACAMFHRKDGYLMRMVLGFRRLCSQNVCEIYCSICSNLMLHQISFQSNFFALTYYLSTFSLTGYKCADIIKRAD
uniref:Uncharacterized protein n=1 Tax=Vitis vinifera TaxID=29760 RepID=F6H853_VITVI